jgi:hypothetical protein
MRRRPTVRILLNKWQRRRKRNKSVKKKIIGGIKQNMKGELRKKMSIIGIVLSFNIVGMKA